MEKKELHLLLADDDIDDCDFFQDALNEVSSPVILATVNNGVNLMDFLLSEPPQYPDLIFLDLNMPRKSGIECLSEIKTIVKLSHIPIIIYSTSLDMDVVDTLYEMGAHYYIRKPGEFLVLKNVIQKAIMLFSVQNSTRPTRDSFILQP